MSARRWKMLRHRVRRLSQIDLREHALLIEATARLITARVQLATVPFPRLSRAMGGFVTPQHAVELAAKAVPTPADHRIARDIGWAVTRAAMHLPFAAVCLPQAMAARAMLQKRKIASVMHFGTARGEEMSLKAHAWLNVGETEVTGYPVDTQFSEVACLVG